MKAVKIEYTVKADYVKTNKENIEKVMQELKSLNAKVRYFVSIKVDGKTFIHYDIFEDEKENVVPNLASFKNFREQLKTGLESPPVIENLEIVNSSFEIF